MTRRYRKIWVPPVAADPAEMLPAIAALASGQPGGWWDSTSGLTAGSWVDRMGNHDLTAIGTPAVVADVQNGRSAARCGPQAGFTAAASPLGAEPATGTLVCLMRQRDLDVTAHPLYVVNSAELGSYFGVDLYNYTGGGAAAALEDLDFNYAGNNGDETGAVLAGALGLVEAYRAAADAPLTIYVNGVSIADANYETPMGEGAGFGFDRVLVGQSRPDAPLADSDLDVFLAHAVPHVYTTPERQIVYDWLAAVYGLTLPAAS